MEDQLVAYRARKAREQSEEASSQSSGRSWFGSKKMSSDPSVNNKEEEDTATENTTKVFSYSGTSSDQPVAPAQVQFYSR